MISSCYALEANKTAPRCKSRLEDESFLMLKIWKTDCSSFIIITMASIQMSWTRMSSLRITLFERLFVDLSTDSLQVKEKAEVEPLSTANPAADRTSIDHSLDQKGLDRPAGNRRMHPVVENKVWRWVVVGLGVHQLEASEAGDRVRHPSAPTRNRMPTVRDRVSGPMAGRIGCARASEPWDRSHPAERP